MEEQASMRSRARILVVDDEELVRELAVDALRDAGYDAVGAASAADGLDRLLAGPPFDLLVTDVRMPEMRGDQLAIRAQRSQPGLKVLCVTGYADDQIAFPLLLKPYRLAQLVGRVEEELAPSALVPSDTTTVMRLLARGDRLRAQLDEQILISHAVRAQAEKIHSGLVRGRQRAVEELTRSSALVAFYDRWTVPRIAQFDPETSAIADRDADSLTLWRRAEDDFECCFSGAEVLRHFGPDLLGNRLTALPRFHVDTAAAYEDTLRLSAPVLLERWLDSDIYACELALPLRTAAVPHIVSIHRFEQRGAAAHV